MLKKKVVEILGKWWMGKSGLILRKFWKSLKIKEALRNNYTFKRDNGGKVSEIFKKF